MSTPREGPGPMQGQRAAVSHTRILCSTPAAVASRVLAARMSGALLGWSEVRDLDDGTGRVAVKVRLAGPAPAAQSTVATAPPVTVPAAPMAFAVARPRMSWRTRALIVGVLAMLGTLAGVVYGLYLLVAAVVAWAAANAYGLTAAGLAAAVLVWLVVRSGAACQGLHCPGCGHDKS